MTTYKLVDGNTVELTSEEEAARDAEEAQALAEQQAKAHKAPRKKEYGDIGDQLD